MNRQPARDPSLDAKLEAKASQAPLVSVIIPTFNRVKTLVRAVRSVLAQTYGDFEIIVVDDASTDGTEAAIDEFRDSRIGYIRHTSRMGGAAARNTGLSMARGRFVAFLDSDDIWFSTRLERHIVQAEQDGEHAAHTLYYAQSNNDDGSKRLAVPTRGKRVSESVAEYICCSNQAIHTIVMFISTDFARQVGFDASLRRHQDIDFCLRLEDAGAKFHFAREPLALYYATASHDQISANLDEQPSYDFLNKHWHRLTPRERRGFRARYVAPRRSAAGYKLSAVMLVLQAVMTLSIGPGTAIKQFAGVLLPPAVLGRLKRLRGKLGEKARSA